MPTQTILPQPRNLEELKKITNSFFQRKISRLIHLCYERGVTQRDIAEALDVTPQNISYYFPLKTSQEADD